jgi:outer membrane protein, heavy metal efflux system
MGLWGQETQWTIASRLPTIPKTSLALGNLEQRAIKASLSLAATRKEIEATAGLLGFTHATAFIPFAAPGVDAKREDGEWDVGPSLNLPIPLFDQGQARLAAARSDLRRAQQSYWAQAVDIRAAVLAARETALSARSRALQVQNVLLPLYTQVVNSTQLQYNAMQVGIFQLLQAKRQQIDAGLRYIDALSDYWLANTALRQTLNGSRANVLAVQMTQVPQGDLPSISAGF